MAKKVRLRAVRPAEIPLALKSYATTGTVGAGSQSLVVASNPGFQIGDSVIIAVGGEAGLGVRGTKGVGGTWPTLSYANATAMNADTTQANNTYGWLLDTGRVYRFATGTGLWTIVPSTTYYLAKAIPKALVAEITNVSGTTLTLDTAATVAATNANVYFDNYPIIAAAIAAITALPQTLRVPVGTYAISDTIDIDTKEGLNFWGRGSDSSTLFSPDGTPSAKIWIVRSNHATVRDLHILGNVGANGFGLAFGTQFVTEVAINTQHSHPGGVLFEAGSSGVIQDCKFTDVWRAVSASTASNTWAYRCVNYQTEAMLQYIQWQFQWADSSGGGCVDCEIDSEYLIHGFEAFRCNGTTFTRPVVRNAVFSMNGSGDFVIDGFDCTIEALSQFDTAFSADEPIVNINTNIGIEYAGLGGTISSINCVQSGAINGSGNILKCININADNPDVTVTGGSITHPNVSLNVGTGVNSTGDNTVVTGLTVIGTNSDATHGNINVPADATVTGCTADRIFIGGVEQ